MKTDNINYNVSDQYVQASHDLGKTSYYNVNTQTTTVVPWGTLDWVNSVIGYAITLTFYSGLIYFGGHFLKFW